MGKKILLFLAGLAASIMLMPGGHAGWKQGVEIKGTVQTGKWHREAAHAPRVQAEGPQEDRNGADRESLPGLPRDVPAAGTAAGSRAEEPPAAPAGDGTSGSEGQAALPLLPAAAQTVPEAATCAGEGAGAGGN